MNDQIAFAPSSATTQPVASTTGWPLRGLVEAAGIATIFTTLDGEVLDANTAGHELFRSLAVPGGRSDGRESLRTVLERIPHELLTDPGGGSWRDDIDVALPGAPPSIQDTTVMVHAGLTTNDDGFIAILCQDVTDERIRTADLIHLIEHDPTTGLYTRAALIERITHEIHQGPRPAGLLGVLMIDVDRLRDVNDALGHEIGDRLLASSAKRLMSAVAPGDLVARLGGDQFMVMCTDLADESAAMEVADSLRRTLTGRLTIRGLELDVSVSVGVGLADATVYAEPPEVGALHLISRADTAVHAAKQAGRARSAMFTDQLQSSAQVRTEMAAALSKALREGQLHVEYQPIFSAVSQSAEAAEALVRWHHPERGRIEASEFIPVAEDTGVIVPISDWVLQQACATTRRWIDDGVVGPKFAVHVNVSRLQLAAPTFAERVVGLLRQYRLRPPQIVLEARETTLLGGDTGDVIRSVQALRRVGVRIALDNFGTGPNALSLMTEIGADVLKLDGTLALASGRSEADTRVVRALVLMAQALNMEVVAERVSGLEQLRRLRAAGCDLVQGHLLGMPAAPDQMVTRMSVD